MKKICYFKFAFILLLGSQFLFKSVFSQSKQYEGIALIIVDSATRQPLQDVDVFVFDKIKDRVVSSFVSDSVGHIYIKGIFHPDSLDKSVFQFYVSGHIQKTISFHIDQFIEGRVIVPLGSKSTALKDVRISHLRNPVSFNGNKMEYNLKSVPNYEHMTSSEILNYLPFLSVEGNDIKMMGKNVIILINNRPHPFYNNVQNLNSLPPQAIERIELSFVPSARNGMEKVLNIILKKNYFLGWNGNFNMGAGRFGYNPNASLGYWANKWGVSFAGNYAKASSWSDISNTTNSYDDKTIIAQVQKVKENTSSGQAFLSVFYDLDSLSTVDLQVGIYPKTVTQKSYGTTTYLDSTVVQSQQLTNYQNSSSGASKNINLNYTHKFRQAGEELYILSQFSHSPSDQNILLSNNMVEAPPLLVNQYYRDQTKTNESTIELLFQNNAKDKFMYTVGGKWIQRWDEYNSNQSLDTNMNQATILSAAYKYNQTVLSGYGDIEMKLSKKWVVHTGLRIEDVKSNYPGTSLQMAYFDAIPNISLTYNPNNANVFSLSYVRDVQRPSFNALVPYNIPSNSFYTDSGNVYLNPQYNNRLGLQYYASFDKVRIGMAAEYQWVHNFIDAFYVANSDGSLVKTYANSQYSGYTVSFNIDLPLSRKIRFSHFMSGGNSIQKGPGYNNSQLSGYIQDKIFYNVSSKQRIYISTTAFSPNITLQGKDQSLAYWKTQMSYSYYFKILKNNSSQISVAVSNPWLTKGLPSYTEQKTPTFYYYEHRYNENPFLSIQFVINFAGKHFGNSSFDRDKDIRNDDLKQSH